MFDSVVKEKNIIKGSQQYLNKVILDPVVILDGLPGLDFLSSDINDGVGQIWILCRGMVSPNHTIFYRTVWNSQPSSYLQRN